MASLLKLFRKNSRYEKSYNVTLTHVTSVREFIEERVVVVVDLLDLSCG